MPGQFTHAQTPFGFTMIRRIIVRGSPATVDFIGIPQTYTTLKVLWFAQDTQAGTSAINMRIRVNNDATSGNYTSTQRSGGQNGSSFGTTQAAAAGGVTCGTLPQSGNTNMVSSGEITIIGYASPFHKRIGALWWHDDGTANGLVANGSARWKSTLPISWLTFTTEGAAFTDGGTFTLYGIM